MTRQNPSAAERSKRFRNFRSKRNDAGYKTAHDYD